MEKTPQTLLEAIRQFADKDEATMFFARLRWPDGPICPRCQSKENTYLQSRRVWKCKTKTCRYQFSAKKGTVFEDSPIGFDKWLPAMWLIANCKNGISSCELARDLGVCQKTAWFMLQRIRLAMKTGSFEKFSDKFDGAIEVDETFIGGRARYAAAVKSGEKKGPRTGKTAVVGFLQRGGQVRLTVIDSIRKAPLQQEIRHRVKPGSTVYTDELKSYSGLDQSYVHHVINHAETYVEGQVHTNGLENFWSLLKRGLGGTYICVRPFQLHRYLDEQVYRFNRRGATDAERFVGVAAKATGKRLTYKELTGKEIKPELPTPPKRPVARYPMGPF